MGIRLMLDGAAAAAWMSPGKINEASACLYTVWLAYGSPHTIGSLAGHTFPTAISAWNYTTKRHYDRNPPVGAAVWFGACSGPRYAGDAHWRDGDVTVERRPGVLGATDYPVYGLIGECTIAQREAQTGRAYLGWTSDFIGNDIQLASTASLGSTLIGDDMSAQAEQQIANIYAGLFQGASVLIDGKVQKFNYGVLPIVAHNQTLIAGLSSALQALATSKGLDPVALQASIESAAKQGVADALKTLTVTVTTK